MKYLIGDSDSSALPRLRHNVSVLLPHNDPTHCKASAPALQFRRHFTSISTRLAVFPTPTAYLNNAPLKASISHNYNVIRQSNPTPPLRAQNLHVLHRRAHNPPQQSPLHLLWRRRNPDARRLRALPRLLTDHRPRKTRAQSSAAPWRLKTWRVIHRAARRARSQHQDTRGDVL